MNRWGDENVDWSGIGEAAAWIGMQLSRWGRIDVQQTKEKFGGVRVYCSIGVYSLYQLIWPYETFFYPKLTKFQQKLDSILIPNWINNIFTKYQQVVYRLVYKRAVKKWPHLKSNIVDEADHCELLKGL